MKRKGLCLLIALALGGGAFAAQAGAVPAHGAVSGASAPQAVQTTDSQDSWAEGYDNRWYVGISGGGYYNDTDRRTNSRQYYFGMNVGRFISSNASIDFFFDHTSRDMDGRGSWATNSYGLAARFYARDWNDWRPYALVAIMGSREINPIKHSWTPAAELGVGLSKTISDMADFRVEAGYRQDFDNKTIRSENGYGDWLLGVTLMQRFGAPRSAPPAAAPVPPPAPVVAPAPPPPPSCDQLDDDNDGVNNCEDQCPSTAAGILVGPNGCPQKVVIDLRGVNFKFDRPRKGETDVAPTLSKPTADSMMILKQAVDTLKRYPQVTVTVAGFTDSIGAASYNQGLSERRAKIVFDYLVAHGVDASRLQGPVGHGEDNPVASNKTDDGRARNRRVELQPEQ